MQFERGGTKPEGEKIFGNGKCELIANFSTTMVTSSWRERREVWREKRKIRVFSKGKCKLIPIVRIFGKGKCKFIANFSAIMVTSLPSISLSLSLSLCISLSLSPKVPHAQYRKRFRASYNTVVYNSKNPLLPLQLPVIPLPVYPAEHWHKNDPSVFWHSPLTSQLCEELVHSIKSE